MRLFGAVVCIAFLAFLLPPSTPPPGAVEAATPLRVTGYIRDAATGAGVAFAIVTASGPVKVGIQAGGSGYYSLALPAGGYAVTASRAGYADQGQQLVLKNRPAQLDFSLHAQTYSQQRCGQSLQALVDAAVSGATVTVPACVYRERVVVAKPLTLAGQPGAEIRGSDVWSGGWTYAGGYWRHPGVPVFPPQNHPCMAGTSRCKWLEQVFLDGTPLLKVASHPTSGQFAVDASRTLFLADDPVGHTVEVTTRQQWISIESNNVTITGFRMRHAADPVELGAIDGSEHSSITIDSNVLSDAAGIVVNFYKASRLKITRNDISRGGDVGIGMSGVTDSLVQGNRIHDNNTQAFDTGWEGAGLKAADGTARLVIDSNEVDHNYGTGLWCDGVGSWCKDITYSNNRIHDNFDEGIVHEISHGAKIFGNVIWNNGKEHSNAGIDIFNSDSCEVYNNILVWNRVGISVNELNRTDNGTTHYVFNTYIHDNTIVMLDRGYYALAWASYYSTRMFDPAQNNRASSNKFGYSGLPESRWKRFVWNQTDYISLAAFNATPGGGGNGRYLSLAEQTAALRSANVPLSAP